MDELRHYGVKGMKWGVRRNKTKTAAHPKKKKTSVKDLSDEELNRKLNRLRKEKEYKDLTSSPAAKVGKTVVTGILVASAVTVAKNYTTKYMSAGVDAGIAAISKLKDTPV